MRVGVIAALPGELEPLVDGWDASVAKDGTRTWTQCIAGDVWVAACSGMGADAARRAFAAVEADGAIEFVLSVGWTGALVPELQGGEARRVGRVVDAQTGEQFFAGGGDGLTLVTTARVADAAEKVRLHAAYGAAMVDMEAATVARMAQMRGVPFGCIKGVSDGVAARLPDLNPFLSQGGQLRMLPFLAYVALRPRYWRAIMRLGRNSAKAARAIRDTVLKFMEENHDERLKRTEGV